MSLFSTPNTNSSKKEMKSKLGVTKKKKKLLDIQQPVSDEFYENLKYL